jgi:uncharacterized membrane protein YjdF
MLTIWIRGHVLSVDVIAGFFSGFSPDRVSHVILSRLLISVLEDYSLVCFIFIEIGAQVA